MIITLMIGLLMFIMFSIVGIAVQSLFENSALSDRKGGKLFDSVWLGIVTFSVYAQIYSLFGAVSEGAVLGALLLTGGIFLFFHKKYLRLVKELLAWQNGTVNKRIIRIILFGVCVIVALSWGVQGIGHYDTYLYHAQNIRWIEEYGIVKGLGNLHNRFAYNSSFMCIQTLFSFKWLLGQSLHTLNTFLWVFMMTYAAGTIQLFKTGKVLLSDFLKLLIFLYLCSESVFSTLSSPHTDMMTLLLVAYMIITVRRSRQSGVA